jgi:hypothetical protein
MAPKPKALSSKWERLPRVRQRFRRSADWLKLALAVDGKSKIVACTKSMKANADILSCMLQTHGLERQGVPYLKKEAGSFPCV